MGGCGQNRSTPAKLRLEVWPNSVWAKSGLPNSAMTPPRVRGLQGWDKQISRFFPSTALIFDLFLSLSLWRSTRGILVVFLKVGTCARLGSRIQRSKSSSTASKERESPAKKQKQQQKQQKTAKAAAIQRNKAAKAAAKQQKATLKLQKHQKQQDRTQQQSSRSSRRCSKNNTTTKAQKKTCKPLGLYQKDPGERVHGRSGHVKSGAADTGSDAVGHLFLFGAFFFGFGPPPSGVPFFSGFGAPPSRPPSSPFVAPRTTSHPIRLPTRPLQLKFGVGQSWCWPNLVWPTLVMAKLGLAKVGVGQVGNRELGPTSQNSLAKIRLAQDGDAPDAPWKQVCGVSKHFDGN